MLACEKQTFKTFDGLGNNYDPGESQQDVGPHLRSKMFDTQTIYSIWLTDGWYSDQLDSIMPPKLYSFWT